MYTPLRMSSVSVAARCEIATAFVTMSFDCAMDAETVHDKRWPCVLFVPKAVDATITDVTIVNTSQGDVYATGTRHLVGICSAPRSTSVDWYHNCKMRVLLCSMHAHARQANHSIAVSIRMLTVLVLLGRGCILGCTLLPHWD